MFKILKVIQMISFRKHILGSNVSNDCYHQVATEIEDIRFLHLTLEREETFILHRKFVVHVARQHTTYGEEKGMSRIHRPLVEREIHSPYTFLTVGSRDPLKIP